MKQLRLLLLPAFLLFGATALRADEIALMQIKFATKKGTQPVALEFYEGDAPTTVANFKKLVKKGYYKGLAFHRAFPNTLVQTGDPFSAKKDRAKVGTGGPGYTLPPEIRRPHTAGAVAMARLPDKLNPSRVSNGSQFFFCLTPMPSYNGQYTVFAHVLYGMEVLNQISNLSVDSNDYPLERVTIRSLKLYPREKVPGAPPLPSAPGSAPAPTAKKTTTTVTTASTPAPTPKPKKPWWKLF